MQLIRIGDKVICTNRIVSVISRMLELRAQGLSQQEVAEKLDIDRTLISRLESIGEIRKGKSIALVGFPIKNKAELVHMAEQAGVDFILVWTQEERMSYARSKNGADLLNEVMKLIAKVRQYNSVVFIGSDERVRMVEALVGPSVTGIEIGVSPLHEDKYVEPESVLELIRCLKDTPGNEGG